MNTNELKSFATQARLILIEGVSRKLSFWGFNEKGVCTEEMLRIPGGYEFREQVFNDDRVYPKWQNLKRHIKDAQTRNDIIEQAAYTWFNRLIAIKMLEVNGYEDLAIAYRDGTLSPMLLQDARIGAITPYHKADQELLRQYIADDEDESAFGLLLTNHCNRHNLLKNIFGSIDDFTELLLPNNLLSEQGILSLFNDNDVIAEDNFKEVELIGWLYQFYISHRKDEVFAGFKKNKKARAEDIPAATQIFTPKWIVKYMVENTAGKLYLDFEPNSSIKEEMKYLVENEATKEAQQSLVSDITEITLLDPACGSGHILVVGFELLMKMYLEQGYNKKQAIQSILEHNLYGLDIDDRAAQLARFAILMKAASYDASILAGNLQVHVYAFPEVHHFTSEDLLTFLDDKQEHFEELQESLRLLNQGKNIGSALKLDISEETSTYLKKQVESYQQKEASASLGLQEQAVWNRLSDFLEVLTILTKQYTAVVANPPYMGQKSMNADLKEYVNAKYPLSKPDLFAVFMEVCLGLSVKNGLMGMINQHSWMFLSSYEKLREEILTNSSILNMLHLGPRTFPELSGEVVQSTAFVLEKGTDNQNGTYFRLVDQGHTNEKEKSFLLREYEHPNIPQTNFSKIPGSPIAYWVSEDVIKLFEDNISLNEISSPRKGNSTSDNSKFLRYWFEISNHKMGLNYKSVESFLKDGKRWLPYNKGGGSRKWYGYNENLIDWKDNAAEIRSVPTSVITNEKFYMEPGLTWSTISPKGFGIRFFENGFIFDNGGCCVFGLNDKREYIAALLNSNTFSHVLGQLNPTLNFQSGEISKFPILYSSEFPKGISNNCKEISKTDWDSRENSWDFDKTSLLIEAHSLTQAFNNWQKQVKQDFFQLHANEEELNSIFIDIYGLQEELSPEVALKDITILQDELDRNALEQLEPVFRTQGKDAIEMPIDRAEVMSQFISYAVGCMMGRYRLDKQGLNIAHPNPSEEELSPYSYEGRPWKIDENAIVPVMGNESPFSDDITFHTKEFIRVVWGDETLTQNLNFLQECLGMDLEKFLVTKFWDYHKRMYKKRPIYWLFSSKKGAFQVLVYMHRMDKYTVQKIRQQYLHRYQAWLSEQIDKLSADEASLSRQEQKKLENYRKAQIECREYDEVLKELAKEQIEFDLDDGVVVNYAKFGEAVRAI